MPRFQILGGAHHRPEIPTTPLKPRDPVTMPRSDLDRGGKECRGRVPRNRPARAANRRYLEFLSAIDDPSNGIDKLNRIMRTVHEEARSYRGFNFFDQDDEALFLALARGEFTISGVQNKALRARFPQYNSRPNVHDLTQASHPRAHQKGEPLLQVLPDGAGETGGRAGPQTQRACHHSRARCCTISPISKFCQFRQEPNYVGTTVQLA